MKEFKKVARFVMALILTVSILVFVLVNIFSQTILNESYILASLEESNYYNKTYKLIESNFENYIQQSGLDEKILENIVTREQVKKDTEKIVSNIYNGINEEISVDNIKKALEKKINEQIEIDSLPKEQKKAIDQFIETICDEYRTTISNSNYESEINAGYKKIMKYVQLAHKVSIVSIGVSIIIIILLNLRRNYKILTNTGISLLASGVILTIINIYINSKIKIGYITILNEPISITIRNILTDILGKILTYGIIFIIISVILIIVANFIHTIIKYKSLMNDEQREDD